MYGIIAIACTYLVLQQRALKIKLLYLGPLLTSFFYMLLAQSRSTLLPLVVAMIVWLLSVWLFHKEDNHNHRNKLLVVLVLISVVISALFIVNPEYFKLVFLRRVTYGYRLEMWGQLLVQIKNAPWFGHGLNADARTIASDGALHIAFMWEHCSMAG
jgi:O-antigen ligase